MGGSKEKLQFCYIKQWGLVGFFCPSLFSHHQRVSDRLERVWGLSGGVCQTVTARSSATSECLQCVRNGMQEAVLGGVNMF